MNKFGMYVKFTAHPGQRDALANNLMDVAQAMQTLAGCHLYIVNISPEESDTVWVTEVWESAADHQASLSIDKFKADIQRTMSLIAKVEKIELQPIGGKGF